MKHIRILILLGFVFISSFLNVLAQETGIEVNTDWDHEKHSWESKAMYLIKRIEQERKKKTGQ